MSLKKYGGGQNPDVKVAEKDVKGVRIVIMNPPFTERSKMGEKFEKVVQNELRRKTDIFQENLVAYDSELKGFASRKTVQPLFVALADRLLDNGNEILTMINPIVFLVASSALYMRRILAQHYHIYMIVNSHQPGERHMAHKEGEEHSLLVLRRYPKTNKPPTKFVNLDKMPSSEEEVKDLHDAILGSSMDTLPRGWGGVVEWPSEYMEQGDWTLGVWRSGVLAEAARQVSTNKELFSLESLGLLACETGRQLRGDTPFERLTGNVLNSFPVIQFGGEDGQKRIQSRPDRWYLLKNGFSKSKKENFLKKGSYLLITEGQNNNSARLVAVADDQKYVGGYWTPVKGVTVEEAKALAVFLNSTLGRIQLMRNFGERIVKPTYSLEFVNKIRVPDIKNSRVLRILFECWRKTKKVLVPQYRDGECEVRRFWDDAVAEAMRWDKDELTRLRLLLHKEPHVCGRGYGEYPDEAEGV